VRIFGHPVHVMLVHFPVALWPAHWVIHCLAGRLPAGATTIAFGLLAAGTVFGWLALFAGAADLLRVQAEGSARRLKLGLIHGGVNGTVLLLFTAAAAAEYAGSVAGVHGRGWLIAEAAVLAALFAGNYFGGALVWDQPVGEHR
jgi:uncharacterized membrane protein